MADSADPGWIYNQTGLCCTNQAEDEFSLPLNGLIPRVEFAVFQGR